jgi:hypothetical protein
VNHIDASVIRAVLREHGVQFLATIDNQQDGAQEGQVVAYLHGYAGPDQQQRAIGMLSRLDGVCSVEASPVSWTILIVRFRNALDEQS